MWWNILASPSPSPGPQDANGSAPTPLVIIVLIIAVLIFMSVAKSKRRFQEAEVRLGGMSDEDIGKLEYRIMALLHRNHGPDMTLAQLGGAVGEKYESVCLVVLRLLRAHLVEVIERVPSRREGELAPDPNRRPDRYDQVRLTSQGVNQVYEWMRRGVINVNGDIIRAEAGAVVNNRSTVVNSFSTFSDKYDPGTAHALMQLEHAVAQARNDEATELLEAFLSELKTARPKPSVLRQLFSGIQEAAPAITAMTDVVVKVSSLFNH